MERLANTSVITACDDDGDDDGDVSLSSSFTVASVAVVVAVGGPDSSEAITFHTKADRQMIQLGRHAVREAHRQADKQYRVSYVRVICSVKVICSVRVIWTKEGFKATTHSLTSSIRAGSSSTSLLSMSTSFSRCFFRFSRAIDSRSALVPGNEPSDKKVSERERVFSFLFPFTPAGEGIVLVAPDPPVKPNSISRSTIGSWLGERLELSLAASLLVPPADAMLSRRPPPAVAVAVAAA